MKQLIFYFVTLIAAILLNGCAGNTYNARVAASDMGVANAASCSSRVLPPDPGTGKFRREDSFIDRWLVIAPDKLSSGTREGRTLLVDEFFESGGRFKAGVPLDGVGKSSRLDFHSQDPQAGELRPFAPEKNDGVLFLVAELDCDRAWQNLTLYAAGTARMRVWINGKMVHTYDREVRELKMDQDEVPGVSLHKGKNRIVVKTIDPGTSWKIRLRLTDSAGLPLRFIPLDDAGQTLQRGR